MTMWMNTILYCWDTVRKMEAWEPCKGEVGQWHRRSIFCHGTAFLSRVGFCVSAEWMDGLEICDKQARIRIDEE